MSALRIILLPRLVESITEDDILAFYCLVGEELQSGGYNSAQREALLDDTCGLGRLFSDETYFKENYCRPFSRAVAHIFGVSKAPRILDLCCGTGTQSLFFAFMGASVEAVDYDSAQLSALQRRVGFYQNETGVHLPIAVQQADATTIDLASLGSFDAIYSHIGIGGLDRAERIFSRAASALRPGGLLVLKNGNPDCVWLRLRGRQPRDSRRSEYLTEAPAHGFRAVSVQGTAGLPRQAWRPVILGRLVSRLLSLFLPFQLSINYVFERLPDEPDTPGAE